MVSIQVRLSDAFFFEKFTVVLPLALHQLPHPAWIPSPVEVHRNHRAVHEQHQRTAEYHQEIGFPVGVEHYDCAGQIFSEGEVGNPHIAYIQAEGEDQNGDDEQGRPKLGVSRQLESDNQHNRSESKIDGGVHGETGQPHIVGVPRTIQGRRTENIDRKQTNNNSLQDSF